MQQRRLNQEEQADHAEDNPALSQVIERNIRTIIQLRLRAARERSVQDRLADAITDFSGRMVFAYVHIVWFGVWILLNTGWVGVRAFDPFPYGLLTMVVSLEAIFLSLFILMSQNRASRMADQRAQLDLQINLLSELESTKALKMLQALCRKNGLTEGDDRELEQLAKKTEPKDLVNHLQASLPDA